MPMKMTNGEGDTKGKKYQSNRSDIWGITRDINRVELHRSLITTIGTIGSGSLRL